MFIAVFRPYALQLDTILLVLGLYASLAATIRAVFLTIRADDVGALESERLTIALALVASIFFLGWRLVGLLVSLFF